MENELSIQSLIEQIKEELLSGAKGPGYPIFFIEKVELDIAVSINKQASGGINVSVLEIGGNISKDQGHTIKIVLVPILTREEQRDLLEEDKRLLDGVKRTTMASLRKGENEILGEPE